MQLTTQADCDAANAKFNSFHDGFLRELRWLSPMRFSTQMPWEGEKHFVSDEQRLFATGMSPIATECLTLLISHYNYDWPNQRNNRLVEIQMSGGIEIEHVFRSDVVILEMVFGVSGNGLSCTIQWEPFGPPDDKSIRLSKFYSERITITEIESAD